MCRINADRMDVHVNREADEAECRRIAIKITLYVIGVLFIAGGIALHLTAEEGNLAGLVLFGVTGLGFIISAIACFQKEEEEEVFDADPPAAIPQYVPKPPPEIAMADELERFLNGEIEELSTEHITQLHGHSGAHAAYYKELKKRLIQAVGAELASLGDEHAIFKAEMEKVCAGDLLQAQEQGPRGNSLLYWAVRLKLEKTKQLLLESGAQMGLAEELANPDLDQNFVAAIEELIDRRTNDPNLKLEVAGTSFANLNMQDPSSFALILWMRSIKNPATHSSIAAALAKPFQMSLLHFAYANDLIQVAGFLKDQGAEEGALEELERLSKNFSDNGQNNRQNKDFVRCIQMICRGCNFTVDARYDYEWDFDKTKWVQFSLLQWAIAEKCKATALMLIEKRAKIGDSDILKAAEADLTEVVRALMARRPRLDVINSSRQTLYHLFVANNDIVGIETLVESEININAQNFEGDTALHDAIDQGNLEIVKVLIEQGASLKICNNNDMMPLNFAAHRGQLDIVKYLLEIDFDFDAIALLLKKHENNIELRKLLDEMVEDIDLDEQDGADNGNTPLHRFLAARNYQMVDFLIAHGADPNIPNISLDTPAEIAARQGKSLKPRAELSSHSSLD